MSKHIHYYAYGACAFCGKVVNKGLGVDLYKGKVV
jgi:ribosomal protein L24E